MNKKTFKNVYFINGTAYAGKSTMVKLLAKKHAGIECYENYHNALVSDLDKEEFPCLTYTRDLKDFSDFVRRTPEEYSQWIDGCNKECTTLELSILEKLSNENKKIFVDTNISIEVLKRIAKKDHVIIMLADVDVSVNRFFDREDKEKQFIYQLLLKEKNPDEAIRNFKECLKKINSIENYNKFINSGFNYILRDEERTIEETLAIVEKMFKLQN